MPLPLAESELQEISAAFDKAQEAAEAAGAAMQELLETLQKRAAFISNKRIEQLRQASIYMDGGLFSIGVQRFRMIKFGASRALK